MPISSWPPSQMAIIYDRVNTRHGGAELVLSALHEAFPQADLVTSVADLTKATWAKKFPRVITSWLQRWPGAARAHRWLAMFMPLAFETLPLQNYELILSVTSAEAKGILTTPDQLHVCYLLAPPRYLYHQKTELLAGHWIMRLPVIHQIAELALTYLRWWDQVAIHRPDLIIPLSQRVTHQLQEFYARPPQTIEPVLYPPVQISSEVKPATLPTNMPTPYFLQVSRLVPYKKVALSMRAAAQAQQNLIVVGEGPDYSSLSQLAQQLNAASPASQITLLGVTDSATLHTLYQQCIAVLAPGEEDFGLTALEANAAGKPIILSVHSGAAEVIQPGVHGLHLATQTVTELAAALTEITQHQWSQQLLRQNAAKYGTNEFVVKLTARLKQAWLTYTAR